MPRLTRVCMAALAIVLLGSVTTAPVDAAARLPSGTQWRADVRHDMVGSRAYLDSVAATGHVTLAVVLDIDNTSLATYYRPGTPVLPVRRFARAAKRLGYAVLFDTGRLASQLGPARALLRQAGFPVTAMCGRKKGERVTSSKPRCRQHFVSEGYRIIANVGNRPTDFSGVHDYRRAFRLPNYDGRLG